MAKSNLRLVTLTTENRTVMPRRAPNAQLRTREHLTGDEVEKIDRDGQAGASTVFKFALLGLNRGWRSAALKSCARGPRGVER